jgi:hypothetical protein
MEISGHARRSYGVTSIKPWSSPEVRRPGRSSNQQLAYFCKAQTLSLRSILTRVFRLLSSFLLVYPHSGRGVASQRTTNI